MIPLKVFIEHKINPVPGAVLTFDNRLGKVLTVSGGRIMVDSTTFSWKGSCLQCKCSKKS